MTSLLANGLYGKPAAIQKRLVFAIRNTGLDVSPTPRIPEKPGLHPARDPKLPGLTQIFSKILILLTSSKMPQIH